MGVNSLNKELRVVKDWLKEIVVGLELCPFAKKPFENDLIRFSLSQHSTQKEWFQDFINELEILNNTPKEKLSTTLLILPKAKNDFRDFHDFVGSLEEFLNENHLAHLYQLVTFHPLFIFYGIGDNERGHYVNRSPFPLIHILRSEEISMAIKSLKDGENISLINDKKLNELSDEIFSNKFSYLTQLN